VVDENDLGLVEGFELEEEHASLDCQRGQKQKVVARQSGAARIPEILVKEQRHHRAAKQASPGLFDAETNELIDEGRRTTPRRPAAEPRFVRDEAPQRRPLGCGACGRSDGWKIVQGRDRKGLRR
jgi:hypothetical protein